MLSAPGARVAGPLGRPAHDERWATALVFLVAAAWRAWVLFRLTRPPGLIHALNGDSETYWQWAGSIVHSGPLGTQPFFLAPLYPYGLAVLRLAGLSVPGVAVLQCLLGALAAALLYATCRRLPASRGVAMFAALLYAGNSIAILTDMQIATESLLLFLGALLVWLIVRTANTAAGLRGRWLVMAGVLVGLLATGRASNLLLLMPAWWLCWRAGTPVEGLRRVVAVSLLALLPTIPIGIRHIIVVREWIPYTYNFGFNFFIGNGPGATGTFHVPHPGFGAGSSDSGWEGGVAGDGRSWLAARAGEPLSPVESSRRLAHATGAHIQRNPTRWAELLGRKLGMAWNHSEYPQLYPAEGYRLHVGALGWPLLGGFAGLGVLGLAGGILSFRAAQSTPALALYLLAITGAMVLFFVVDRYRIHLLPPLVPLAALCLEAMRRSSTLQEWSRLAPVLLAAGAVVALPFPQVSPAQSHFGLAMELGSRYVAIGDFSRAVHVLDEAETGARQHPEWRLSSGARAARAAAAALRAKALERLGRLGEAASAWQEVLETHSGVPEVHRSLADLHAAAGRPEEALSHYHLAGITAEAASELQVGEAARHLETGDTARALRVLETATSLHRSNELGWVARVRLLAAMGELEPAVRVLEQAHRNGLADAIYWGHRAWLLTLAGDLEAAQGALRHIEPSRRSDPRIAEQVTTAEAAMAAGR